MSDARAQPRLVALDSVRGIAASLVLLYHCWLAAGARELFRPLAAPAIVLRTVAAFLEMGRAAVMIFFVLSGFVLAYALLDRPMRYRDFVRRRVLRIYPAFAVVVIASFALHKAIGTPQPVTSVLLERIAAPGISMLDLLKTLSLWGTARSVDLDLVVWSLVHEMRISLAFPLLLLALTRTRSLSLMTLAALSLGCALSLHAMTGRIPYGFVETTFGQTFAVTGYVAVFFAGGVWLALERARIRAWLESLAPAGRTALMALACLMLLDGDRGAERLTTILIDYAHGVAAMIIIAMIACKAPAHGAWVSPVLQWLGQRSYSLYLVHLPIIYVMYEVFPAVDPLLLGGGIVVASLGGAEILARAVEFPCLAFSRRTPVRLKRVEPSVT